MSEKLQGNQPRRTGGQRRGLLRDLWLWSLDPSCVTGTHELAVWRRFPRPRATPRPEAGWVDPSQCLGAASRGCIARWLRHKNGFSQHIRELLVNYRSEKAADVPPKHLTGSVLKPDHRGLGIAMGRLGDHVPLRSLAVYQAIRSQLAAGGRRRRLRRLGTARQYPWQPHRVEDAHAVHQARQQFSAANSVDRTVYREPMVCQLLYKRRMARDGSRAVRVQNFARAPNRTRRPKFSSLMKRFS